MNVFCWISKVYLAFYEQPPRLKELLIYLTKKHSPEAVLMLLRRLETGRIP